MMPLTETSPLGQPSSPYGRLKLMVEQVLSNLCAADPRWPVAVLRYFSPIGAHLSGQIGEGPNDVPITMPVAVGRQPSLADFGSDDLTPDGTCIRAYLPAMDLAKGHLAAMEYLKRIAGWRVWSHGTGRGSSVLEGIVGLKQVIGRDIAWHMQPRCPGDAAQSWADPSHAAQDLGWCAERRLDEIPADHWVCQEHNPQGYAN